MEKREPSRQIVEIVVRALPNGMKWNYVVTLSIFNMRGFYCDLGYVGQTRRESSAIISRHLWRTLKSKGMINRAYEARRRLEEMNIAPEIYTINGRYKPLWSELTTIKTTFP